MRGWMWNGEVSTVKIENLDVDRTTVYIRHRIISRKGKHRSQDESNDVEELEFGTENFLGEDSTVAHATGV